MEMKSLFIELFLVLLYLTAFSSASRLKDLLLKKYASHFIIPEGYEMTFEEDGEIVTLNVPPPPSFECQALSDPENLVLLDRFESDPESVYSNRSFFIYAFRNVIRDYRTDETSREIVDYYREIGLTEKYIDALIYFAFLFNVQEVIEIFIDKICFILSNGIQGQETDLYWINAVSEGGSFAIVKSLMTRGIYITLVPKMIHKACTHFNPNHIEATIDFLDFLINQRREFDINTKILTGRTFLMICLDCKTTTPSRVPILSDLTACQTRIANFLIASGADPLMRDENGLNSFEIASLQGITLTVPVLRDASE